jgi:predicted RNA-binding Zn ribbon-like protein
MTTAMSLHRASGDHRHETSLDDTFDFMNTLELEDGFLVDRLQAASDAARWLAERGVIHGDIEARNDAVALARVRSVREALREVAHAVAEARPADPDAVAEVNRALQGRERVELVAAVDGVSVGHSHVGDPLDDALARLADPLVHEISTGNAARVRICANDTCQWVFFDESRAARRRWCDMATCGNRAKAARHRARKKRDAPAAASEAASLS